MAHHSWLEAGVLSVFCGFYIVRDGQQIEKWDPFNGHSAVVVGE